MSETTAVNKRVEPVPLERAAWMRLRAAKQLEEVAPAWLMLQCQQIGQINKAVLVLGEPGLGPYHPVAVWPTHSTPDSALTEVSELALAQGVGIAQRARDEAGEACSAIAQPVEFSGRVAGVVAVQMSALNKGDAAGVLQQLQWGVGQLELVHLRNLPSSEGTRAKALGGVVASAATVLEQGDVRAASAALCVELARTMAFDRVSLGFVRAQDIELAGVSDHANFAKNANLIRAIETAMDDVIESRKTIAYPVVDAFDEGYLHAHNELAKERELAAVVSVPLGDSDSPVGVLTAERHTQPITPDTIALLEHIGRVCGPIFALKQRIDQPVRTAATNGMARWLGRLFGRGHWLLKGLLTVLLLVVVAMSVIDGDYRITADARLEGAIERIVAAPFPSYVSEVMVSPGDEVAGGQVLARLDGEETRLELEKWRNQSDQLRKQYSESTASYSVVEAQVIRSQLGQAQSQIDLLSDRLERTEITAPFDGIVITGDLTRSIGEPVDKGQLLFKVSPLEDYRVVIEVDERDIREISIDRIGELTLSSMPSYTLPVIVERVTPVSRASEGQNTFRVEARFVEQQQDVSLRPGMTGAAKLDVGERKLIWIWTHRFFEWVRLQWWSWFG